MLSFKQVVIALEPTQLIFSVFKVSYLISSIQVLINFCEMVFMKLVNSIESS